MKKNRFFIFGGHRPPEFQPFLTACTDRQAAGWPNFGTAVVDARAVGPLAWPRDCGASSLCFWGWRIPSVETLGYFQMSLRDLGRHGRACRRHGRAGKLPVGLPWGRRSHTRVAGLTRPTFFWDVRRRRRPRPRGH
jgi:hypothetical protein